MTGRRIRMLLAAGLVLPAALLFTPAQAQFGRPPIGPGGIAGRPGGIGGIRGMPGGINGGIAGRPGGIGGMPGGLGQTEWVCGKCGRVIGHGPVKPIIPSCPFCGVHFTNGMDFGMAPPGGGPPIGGPPMGGLGGLPAGGPPADAANIPPTEPNQPIPPPANNPLVAPAANNNNNAIPAPLAADAAPEGSGKSSVGRTVLIVGAIGCGVLLLVAALGTFLYISASRSSKDASPKRRRKRVYHDEDDD